MIISNDKSGHDKKVNFEMFKKHFRLAFLYREESYFQQKKN